MGRAARETGMQHPGWERFNKWTGHLFAGALLLAALVFAAPWKVMLFLAFTFASSVGLIPRSVIRSKGARCLVGGLLILWLVWTFLPSDPGDYQPFRFVEERARLEQEHAVSEDQNAAATYARLLQESEPNDRVLPPWIKASGKTVRQRPWRREEYPEIARWLDERRTTIEALKSLAEYNQCRFPTEPVLQALDSSNPRRDAVRTWAHLLVIAANQKAGEQDIAGALPLYALTLKIATHHLQQFYIVDYLVGLAVEKMALDGLSSIAVYGSPAPAELAAMEALTATPSHEWTGTWHRIMRFECLSVKNSLCQAVYETDSRGHVRYSRSSYPDYKGIKSPYLRSVNGKSMASAMWMLLPGSPWEFARCVDERYEQFAQIGLTELDSASARAQHPRWFRANHEYVLDRLIGILDPGYYRIGDFHTRSVAVWKGCRIILILRRYKDETGRWPASLDEVAARGDPGLWTDPLNGGSFVYQPEGQTFRLYSRGQNGVDENGEWRSGAGDDWPLWPPRSQSPEPADANGV